MSGFVEHIPFEEIHYCPSCGAEETYPHDHKQDNTGLDDGQLIEQPRRKAEPKPAQIVSNIRARAWATRRAKYGSRGHR